MLMVLFALFALYFLIQSFSIYLSIGSFLASLSILGFDAVISQEIFFNAFVDFKNIFWPFRLFITVNTFDFLLYILPGL